MDDRTSLSVLSNISSISFTTPILNVRFCLAVIVFMSGSRLRKNSASGSGVVGCVSCVLYPTRHVPTGLKSFSLCRLPSTRCWWSQWLIRREEEGEEACCKTVEHWAGEAVSRETLSCGVSVIRTSSCESGTLPSRCELFLMCGIMNCMASWR